MHRCWPIRRCLAHVGAEALQIAIFLDLQHKTSHALIASLPPMADHQSLEQQLREAREEAELTLEQLHLVQEELEHYFLAHQEAETKLQRTIRAYQVLRKAKMA